MTAEFFSLASLIFYILAGVCLLLAIGFRFAFKKPNASDGMRFAALDEVMLIHTDEVID